MKKITALLTILVITLAFSLAISTVKADNERLIPISPIGTVGSNGPLIINSPAQCELYLNGGNKDLYHIWILFSIPSTTYNSLPTTGAVVTIKDTDTGGGTLYLYRSDFHAVSSDSPASGSSNPAAPQGNPYTNVNSYNQYYPGTSGGYTEGNLESFLSSSGPFYWAIIEIDAALPSGTLPLTTSSPVNHITITCGFTALVFGMGVTTNSCTAGLDEQTPPSGSTLITTPEITTLVLIPVAIGAGALYVKHKKKSTA